MPLQMIRQDITKIKCDAIVNPTNEYLYPSGGADATIHAAAGPKLYDACFEIGHVDTGDAVITSGFDLPCKYVIHTAGPVWMGGEEGESALLASCYERILELAVEHRCESIAIPLISSGLYGYPKDLALQIAIRTVSDFLFTHELLVYLVVFDKSAYQISGKLFRDVTEFIDDHYVYAHSDNPREREEIRRSIARSVSAPRVEASYCDVEKCLGAAPSTRRKEASLSDLLKDVGSKSFAKTLFRFIDQKGISDVECYKKANIDKKTFSKIKCSESYRPSKPTILAFAIALELTLDETQELLATVGFTLSHSSKFDVIIEYFISRGRYDIFEINETLFEFDQSLLGC